MVESLTEEQWRWRPTPVAHTIAFEVWHAARHDDLLQTFLPGFRPDLEAPLGQREQIWRSENLAQRWSLDPKVLGFEETGSGMEDAVAAALPLPGKAALLDYARRAFIAMERVVESISDNQLSVVVTVAGETVPLGAVFVGALLHDEWTIGYIASLRRAQEIPRIEA